MTAMNKIKYRRGEQLELELVRYSADDRSMVFDVDVIRDTIWATERQIVDLFASDPNTVAAHVQSIFEDGELDQLTCSRSIRPKRPHTRPTKERHLNLDVILAVGYRVSSPKATRFRRWATQALRSYLVDGYCVTEECVRDRALSNDLAQRLQSIRTAETNIYESVRAFFKEADDYDADAGACAYFNELVQAKFIFAITSQTPSELLNSRADHDHPNMGLQTFAGTNPTMDDAKLSENYLNRDELYLLHILCEQFLLYVRSLALRRKKMTMHDLLAKLDDLLRVADYPVYQGFKDFYREKALRHAQAEYAMYAMRQKPTSSQGAAFSRS